MDSRAFELTAPRLRDECGLSGERAAALAAVAAATRGLPAERAWQRLLTELTPEDDFRAHEALFHATYAGWNEETHGPAPCWFPSDALVAASSAARFVASVPELAGGAADFGRLYDFS
eukprot:2315808-Prymnesium_polylepis.1